MDHVAVHHVGPQAPNQPGQPQHAAGIGETARHLQRLGRDATVPRLESHRTQRGERDDQHLVAAGAQLLGRGQQLAVRTAHPHAGREETDPHTSRSRERTSPRRTSRLSPGRDVGVGVAAQGEEVHPPGQPQLPDRVGLDPCEIPLPLGVLEGAVEPAPVVDVMLAHDVRDIGELPPLLGHPDVEPQIDQVVDLRISAGFAPRPPAEGRDGVRDGHVARHGRHDGAVLGGRHADIALAPALIHQHVVPAHHAHLGMGIEIGDLVLQPIGVAAVVEVLPGDVLTPRLLHAEVVRRRGAQPAGGEHPDPAVARLQLPQLREARVGGAVIDQDELEVLEGLCQDAGNGPVEVWLSVIDRGHHADPGGHVVTSGISRGRLRENRDPDRHLGARDRPPAPRPRCSAWRDTTG